MLPWLPEDLPAAVVIALHLPPARRYGSVLPKILAYHARLPVEWVRHGQTARCGHVYVAPQDSDTTIANDGTFCLAPRTECPRPSVDRLFTSVALTFGPRALGIVLSGWLADGALGARHLVENGGALFVQDRATSQRFDMPHAALRMGIGALVLPAPVIAAAVVTLLMAPGARGWFQPARVSPYLASAMRTERWCE